MFLWADLLAKNNNELLANLGNFSNRALKFAKSAFKGEVPAYGTAALAADDEAFYQTLTAKVKQYVEVMEAVKLRDGLRVAMEYSAECNGYFQANKPWELQKQQGGKVRCAQVVNTALNALFMLCVILEPYMPSFSAKVYEQFAIAREAKHETLIEAFVADPSIIRSLVPAGHKIGNPEPIFEEIKPERAEAWKAQFAGKKQ